MGGDVSYKCSKWCNVCAEDAHCGAAAQSAHSVTTNFDQVPWTAPAEPVSLTQDMSQYAHYEAFPMPPAFLEHPAPLAVGLCYRLKNAALKLHEGSPLPNNRMRLSYQSHTRLF
jgi:hypothetical protein